MLFFNLLYKCGIAKYKTTVLKALYACKASMFTSYIPYILRKVSLDMLISVLIVKIYEIRDRSSET